MSYTPTVWKSGDVVSSLKLNKLENGVAAAAAGVDALADESSYFNSVLSSSDENWYGGSKAFVYTTSTFSGFATNWTISSAKYVKCLKFALNSRAQTNITEIRVRIECEDFALERSISVDVGAAQTTVSFPVDAIIPAGTVWVGIAANKIATFMFDGATAEIGFMYWTGGDMSHLSQLKNEGGSSHRLYLEAECYDKSVYIPDESISQEKLSFAEKVIPENLVNIDDEAQCKKGWWYYSTNVGQPIALSDASQYDYTGLTAETYGAEKITVDTFPTAQNPPKVYWIGAADENMILLSYSIANANVPITYTMPAGAKYVLISLQSKADAVLQKLMVVQGTEVTEYVKGTGLRYLLKQCMIEDNSSDAEPVSLKLPASYDLVVGDTFQLFKKGIINAVNPDWFFVQFNCSKGSGFERMFEVTPTETGTLALNVLLYDQQHNLIDSGQVNLNVHAAPTSPASQTYVLCVGDSLTTGGIWPKELNRRLTGSGGSPAGSELSNITFIGTRENGDTHYEGYGGWTFQSYNTANVDINAKLITCSHDKTEAEDQHSIYKDANNAQWKLETIGSGQIKIIAVSGAYENFPSTGTLTWVSGGVNHSNIVYTASQNAPGNPFWNSAESKVDFSWYCGQIGAPRIDYVLVLIGWNNASITEVDLKSHAQTFIDNVHASYPDAKILLVGLQIPAIDGLGYNYGASGTYADFQGLMAYVNNLDAWYDDLAESNSNVYHINLAGQFDTEYNMPTGQTTVNSRNSETVTIQTNGVHPAQSGYYQIADAVYRAFTGLLAE